MKQLTENIALLDGVDNCRNVFYAVLQRQLREPMLHERVGRDLSQLIMNMNYSQLSKAHKEQFDKLIFKLAMGDFQLVMIGEGQDSETSFILKECFRKLRLSIDRILERPDIKFSDSVVITDENHRYYGDIHFSVIDVKWNIDLDEWEVTVGNPSNVKLIVPATSLKLI